MMFMEEVMTLQDLNDIQVKLNLNPYEAWLAFARACEFHGTIPRLADDAIDVIAAFTDEHLPLFFPREEC